MRVRPETKERTRADLLQAAERLFAEVGFGTATTRAIAAAAGVAAGTVFNYFPTKEALAAALLARGYEAAWGERDASARAEESVEEALFALIATELRHLAPRRAWIPEVVHAGLSPLRRGADAGAAELRVAHLERVVAHVRAAGLREPGDLTLHLYWTLYLGVLGFWSRDDSEHQEATLALLDRSIRLFAHALREDEPTET